MNVNTLTQTHTRALWAWGMVLILALLLVIPASASANHDDDGSHFETELKGANEVPAVTPEKISGNGGVWFGPDGAFMNFWLFAFAGDERITGAHLHCGSSGENGPVIVGLFESPSAEGIGVEGELARAYLDNGDIESADCQSTIGRDITSVGDLAEAIADGLIYLNIHSVNHPAGVARGQLTEHVISHDSD